MDNSDERAPVDATDSGAVSGRGRGTAAAHTSSASEPIHQAASSRTPRGRNTTTSVSKCVAGTAGTTGRGQRRGRRGKKAARKARRGSKKGGGGHNAKQCGGDCVWRRHVYSDGGVFEGTMRRAVSSVVPGGGDEAAAGQGWLRHGEGTYTDHDGNVLRGTWVDDKATGCDERCWDMCTVNLFLVLLVLMFRAL